MGGGVSLAWRGATGSAQCSVYADRTPILCGDGTGMSLSLTPSSPQMVTPAEVSFARELLAELGTYVAECERWTHQVGEVSDTSVE